MFDRKAIHVALLMWGCIFCLIAALCMFMSRNFDKEKRGWMLGMQLSAFVLLGSDALAWAFRGNVSALGWYMVRISNFLVFAMSDVIMFLFHAYTCCYLFGSGKAFLQKNEKLYNRMPKHRMGLVFVLAIVGVFLVVLSQFTGLYYSFDSQNMYHRNAGYIISFLLPFVGMVVDLSMMIQYRGRISHQIFVSMISYIVLPFAATVVQLVWYGTSLINIAISISMILMFVAAMVEQNENLAHQKREAAELRISLMLSQITPHFIYNTLTSIRKLCVTDPVMAQQTIEEFAGYLRENIDALSEKEPVPFERELKHVQCYLAIEKKRFGDRVNVQYDIQETDFSIPALTLQPLVENAVKHGLCKKENGGTVTIRTERKAEMIYITIEDDGIGFDKEHVAKDDKVHIGVSNVRERLKNMCNGKLQIESKKGKGTMVVISLEQ